MRAGQELAQKYATACKESTKARIKFWHECGRLFYPDSPRFRLDHELSYLHRQILNELFDAMQTTGCYVLAHVMNNWPTEGKYKTPSLDQLEAWGATHVYQDWLKHNNAAAMKTSLNLVAANLAAGEAA